MWGGSCGFYKEASGKSERESVGHSVAFNSLWPHRLWPPGPSVHGILQARMLEWVAILFPRGSSRPREIPFKEDGSFVQAAEKSIHGSALVNSEREWEKQLKWFPENIIHILSSLIQFLTAFILWGLSRCQFSNNLFVVVFLLLCSKHDCPVTSFPHAGCSALWSTQRIPQWENTHQSFKPESQHLCPWDFSARGM